MAHAEGRGGRGQVDCAQGSLFLLDYCVLIVCVIAGDRGELAGVRLPGLFIHSITLTHTLSLSHCHC